MPPKEVFLEPDVGSPCLFFIDNDDEKHGWTQGTVQSWDGKIASCKAKDPSNPVAKWETGKVYDKLKAESVYCVTNAEVLDEDVHDLLNLTVLHDSTLLHVLRKRFINNYVYTNVGAITVALNPFTYEIPWYKEDQMPKYLSEGERIENNIPHSWAVAHNTYWEMRTGASEKADQCVLVSGESGAGKTEAAKIVMKYLAALSCKSGSDAQKQAALSVGSKINTSSNPLECFGNASTVRNPNSSRFGKWMCVKFSSDGFLVGAQITKYLLEKSRIVTAAADERVYHAFYVLAKANNKSNWGISSERDYNNTKAGGRFYTNKTKDGGIDESIGEFNTSQAFDDVSNSLLELDVSPEVVNSVWSVVAGVMNIENVVFESDGGEGSVISAGTKQWLDKCIQSWGIRDPEELKKEMVTKKLEVNKEISIVPLNPFMAKDARSALSKAIYDHEFTWIIETCNKTLDVESDGNWIGLLDIFGFENFKVNSFEQLCINLANETLQLHYNKYIFEKDQMECKAENIDVSNVEFPDNAPCCRMITQSILTELDSTCSLGSGTDDDFLSKVTDQCQDAYKDFFLRRPLDRTSFTIHHYAADVSYEVEGFLEKNKDTLRPEMKRIMRDSTDPFIASLLPSPDEDDSKKMTVGGYFKSQVADLMELIESTNPHWIRCIKAHPQGGRLNFEGVHTLKQLSSSGVLGTVKIRKAGYPVRIKFDRFTQRYSIISPNAADPASILKEAGLETKDAQVGTSRVFLKSEAYVDLEKLRKQKLEVYNAIVLAHCRAYLAIMDVKGRVLEKNKSVVDGLREQVKKELKEKEAQLLEQQKAAAEAEKAKLEAERQALAAVAEGLANIGNEADISNKAIVDQEQREWDNMFESFNDEIILIEEAIIEREERELRERLEREAAEQKRIDDAATLIQSTFRGYHTREQILMELTERARSQLEFDLDANMFRQHMLLTTLDVNRLKMEADYLAACRSKAIADEREAYWKQQEARRQAQVRAVEARKMEKYQAQQKEEELITEFALSEAHRRRNTRLEDQERARDERLVANIDRRRNVKNIENVAFAMRQQKIDETAEYMARRQDSQALTQAAFAAHVEQSRAKNEEKKNAEQMYSNGQSQYADRERALAIQELDQHALVHDNLQLTKSPIMATPPPRFGSR